MTQHYNSNMVMPSTFRVWVANKWYEHRDENEAWGCKVSGSSADYFRKYKWFLKTIYQKEKRHAQ